MALGGFMEPITLDDALHLIEHLRRALETRETIGQAQGVLMERYGLDPDTAFAFLKRLSSTRETTIRDLSEQIVSGAQIEA
jgi:AmiR/NasT family two-component response regulator